MSETESWTEANQRALTAALARAREALVWHAARRDAQAQEQEQAESVSQEAEPARAAPIKAPTALENLCAIFGLSPFERDVLLLCAGVDLDSTFAGHCAAASGDVRKAYPTFSLALAALPDPLWSALLPVAPLRRWRLIELGTAESITTSPLRIDERILHYLTGLAYLDERLQGLVEPLRFSGELPPSQQRAADRLVECWQRPAAARTVQLFGSDDAAPCAVAAAACAALGVPLHAIRRSDIPAVPAELEAFVRLWEREALLSGSALLVDCAGCDHAETSLALIERVRGLLVIAGREPLRDCRRPLVKIEVSRPAAAEQQQIWIDALGPLAARLNGELDRVTAQFDLGAHSIQAAGAELSGRLVAAEEAPGAALWDICRAQARRGLEGLAQRIEPAATWDDLVLPEQQRQILREMALQVRQRATVYERWGFSKKSARGLGISALFSGASGTGKTMAAEVLANELRLDLFRIDLSSVVSKYIGETEKNLARVFDAAEGAGAILLFDEADALFGKRSEVKDSHDRYANIEVSYLLQRMESYRGLAILTTNMKTALDAAFLRRIRFVVQFPFPDVALRAEIWRRVFPIETPSDGLDVARLARLNVPGGNIRNIALRAAFLAADAGEPVRMTHLLSAARGEYAKMEKPLTEAEIGGWA